MPPLDSDAAPNQPASFPLGERLKRLRLQLGISQRELARRADMTNGNLSQIEKGAVSPSLASLEKILAALNISLADFFADNIEWCPAVVRREQLVQIHKKGIDYHILPVTEAREAPIYLVRQTLAPGAATHADWMAHKGTIAGLVISGQLTLKIDATASLLNPGDGFHFPLHQRFVLHNPGEALCELVVVSLLP